MSTQEPPSPEPIEESFAAFAARFHEPPRWVLTNLIPEGCLINLAGTQKALKTWLALAIATAVARGLPFIGRPTMPGTVLYVLEEGSGAALAARIRKIAGTLGAPEAAFLILRKGISLDTREGLAALRDVISRRRPVLVILDPLVRFHQAEENDAREMARVMGAAQSLTTPGTTVLLVHHTAKKTDGYASVGGVARGSGVIVSSSDGNIILRKRPKSEQRYGGVRLVLTSEMRDAEDERIGLFWDAATGRFSVELPDEGAETERYTGDIDPESVLSIIEAQGRTISASVFARAARVSQPTARKILREAVERGDLEADESARPVLYQVVEA